MRKSRFTEEQIIEILKEHPAGISAGDTTRKFIAQALGNQPNASESGA